SADADPDDHPIAAVLVLRGGAPWLQRGPAAKPGQVGNGRIIPGAFALSDPPAPAGARDTALHAPRSPRLRPRSRADHHLQARWRHRRGFPRGGATWWCRGWARSTASAPGATRAPPAPASPPARSPGG